MTTGYPPVQSQRPNDDERTVYLGSKNVDPAAGRPIPTPSQQQFDPRGQHPQAQQPHSPAPQAYPPANPQYAPQQSPSDMAQYAGPYGWGNQAPPVPQSSGGSKVAMIAVAVVVALISVATLSFALTRSSKDDAQAGPGTASESGQQSADKSTGQRDTKSAETTEPTPTPAPAAPIVAPSAVNDLLMSIPEAAETLGTGPMVGREGFGDKIYTISTSKIVDQDCISVLPAQLDTYQGSGYSALGQQFLSSTTQDIKMTQSAATFADAAAAFRFVTATRAKWEKCAGRTVNFQSAGDPTRPSIFFTLGSVSQSDGMLNLVRTQEGQGEWRCQNALTSRHNVVIDLLVCGDGMQASTANAAAEKIAQKVTAAAH